MRKANTTEQKRHTVMVRAVSQSATNYATISAALAASKAVSGFFLSPRSPSFFFFGSVGVVLSAAPAVSPFLFLFVFGAARGTRSAAAAAPPFLFLFGPVGGAFSAATATAAATGVSSALASWRFAKVSALARATSS